MTSGAHIPTSLAKHQGPAGNPNQYERHARNFWNAGGAILRPDQMKALSPSARAEVEKQMEIAYGKRKA